MQGTQIPTTSEPGRSAPAASTTSTTSTTSSTSADVELRFPAHHVNVRIARLAASGIGAQLGADVEQIEELRLLVDEACALLLECTVPGDVSDDRLSVTFRPTAGSVTVIAERVGAKVADHPSPISVAVLDGISDEWSFEGVTVIVRAALDAGTR